MRGALNLERRFIDVIGVIVYYIYSGRAYFSLFNDAYYDSDRPTFKTIMIFY